MLDGDGLYKKLWEAVGSPKDSNGLPVNNLAMLKAFSNGYITQLKASKTTHAPGTVSGAGIPFGGAFSGAAMGGKVIGFVPAPISQAMIAATTSALNPQAIIGIQTMCATVAAFVQGNAQVNFKIGSVSGNCTATSEAPGALVAGVAQDGKIQSLVGSVLFGMLSVGSPIPLPYRKKWCDALCAYTMENAQVNYMINTVVGSFPPGGGAIQGGAATGGIIS
jgi:hypothetical protein